MALKDTADGLYIHAGQLAEIQENKKMVETTAATDTAVSRQDEQAFSATVHSLALRTPPNVLITVVTSGLAAGCAIAFYRPQWWIAGLLAVVLTACGLWGMAERALSEIRERSSPDGNPTYWTYLMLRGYTLAVVVVAGTALFVFAFHVLLGNVGVGGG